MLQQVAATLQGSVRQMDLVGRYGGAEFRVILPETREDRAMTVAEWMRLQINQLETP